MTKWIVLIIATLYLTISCTPQPVATSSATPSDPSSATVRIVCTWQRTCDQGAYDVTVDSLGTVIAPNIILTHNHYGLTLGRRMSDTLVITDNTNHTWRGRAVDAQLIVINASTGLIWLPDDLVTQAAPLVDSRDLQSLTVNEWLTVNYWDDTAGHVAQRDFQIVQIKDGVAKLADPDRLINLGDSGGSVYLDGKLIGNIWSIELDGAYQAMGSFNVALLPSQVRSYVP